MAFKTTPKKPITRVGNSGYEFHSAAAEITILDSRGHAIWRKQKWESAGPIHCEGVVSQGKIVELGEYVCKILYPDGETIYVPFVFVR